MLYAEVSLIAVAGAYWRTSKHNGPPIGRAVRCIGALFMQRGGDRGPGQISSA